PRAVLDLLVGPHLRVGLDHARLADLAEVPDHDALGEERVGAHHALAPDDRLLDHRARPDLHALPQHAALDLRAGMDDDARSDDRVHDPGPGRDVCVLADDDRAAELGRVVEPRAVVQPDGVAWPVAPSARDVDADLAL